MQAISEFQKLSLSKLGLMQKPLLWKWVLICMTMKKHFHINGYALTLVLNKMADEKRKIKIESLSDGKEIA